MASMCLKLELSALYNTNHLHPGRVTGYRFPINIVADFRNETSLVVLDSWTILRAKHKLLSELMTVVYSPEMKLLLRKVSEKLKSAFSTSNRIPLQLSN